MSDNRHHKEFSISSDLGFALSQAKISVDKLNCIIQPSVAESGYEASFVGDIMSRPSRIAAIFMLFAMTLNASPVFAGGWSPPLTVTHAFVEDSDNVVIYTTGGGQHTPGCAPNAWIFVAATDVRRDRAWATILSALMGGKKIQFWYADTCAAWSYHRANSVMILVN